MVLALYKCDKNTRAHSIGQVQSTLNVDRRVLNV